ncbi:hypothetical protein [Methanimicrococcus blatticola]|uniref:Uncharacterized protein n=1 Tax=Methanimicrococcus blatticola TaxID=91560 RepID=A0A484F368_9EURY|nr:hypothetical protein [Methanimicrococcus blatticola]MBZ3935975.1 hypothetical protein [Methanimicrococcus blatticola]MCC2509412.1 hypothetical protein [Methanimicrococcus blatticola]TDQ68294.1 hypothetical protein C7391_1234 [Methanimicrococcus blatticola]
MTDFTYTEESKSIDKLMKNFKVLPYAEVSARLDRAANETVAFAMKNKKTI